MCSDACDIATLPTSTTRTSIYASHPNSYASANQELHASEAWILSGQRKWACDRSRHLTTYGAIIAPRSSVFAALVEREPAQTGKRDDQAARDDAAPLSVGPRPIILEAELAVVLPQPLGQIIQRDREALAPRQCAEDRDQRGREEQELITEDGLRLPQQHRDKEDAGNQRGGNIHEPPRVTLATLEGQATMGAGLGQCVPMREE